LPHKVLEEVGAWRPVAEVKVELGNGEKVKAKAYGVAIKIEEVEAPSISIIFEWAQTVIGVVRSHYFKRFLTFLSRES